jgi:hypothetical protein
LPKLTYRNCRTCGRSTEEVGVLSHTRQCEQCGITQLVTNVSQMSARSGPNFEKWRRAMVACVHPELLDAMDSNP